MQKLLEESKDILNACGAVENILKFYDLLHLEIVLKFRIRICKDICTQ